MRRRLIVRAAVVLGLGVSLGLLPATATADPIFDQADADELADTLAEAYTAQDVCYGWVIDVDNVGLSEQSAGSNFGAGTPLRESPSFSSCERSVEFQATVTWTSESSESEDSASYSVSSTPTGPTTADLNSLELIDNGALAGDNSDAAVYKAVSALPLLAADSGIADAVAASPAPESASAGERATNSPGSDFWRESGKMIIYGVILLLAAGAFLLWVKVTSKAPRNRNASQPLRVPFAPYDGALPSYEPPRTGGAARRTRPPSSGRSAETDRPAVESEPDGPGQSPPADPGGAGPTAPQDPKTRPEG